MPEMQQHYKSKYPKQPVELPWEVLDCAPCYLVATA
jgi:hypothetical protein